MKCNTKKALTSISILFGIFFILAIFAFTIYSYPKIMAGILVVFCVLLLIYGIYVVIYEFVSNYYDKKRRKTLQVFE